MREVVNGGRPSQMFIHDEFMEATRNMSKEDMDRLRAEIMPKIRPDVTINPVITGTPCRNTFKLWKLFM